MTYSAPLPNTGVILPVPGSGQAWELPVFNANFTGVENAFVADRGRLSTIEGKIGNNGVIPAGSSAVRDGFYGVPASAAARVALAASGARWFNTDVMKEQVYYAKTGDAGAAANQTQPTQGWLVMAPSGGLRLKGSNLPAGITMAEDGTFVLAAAASILVDSILGVNFRKIKIGFEFDMSAAVNFQIRGRAAGAYVAPTGHQCQLNYNNTATTMQRINVSSNNNVAQLTGNTGVNISGDIILGTPAQVQNTVFKSDITSINVAAIGTANADGTIQSVAMDGFEITGLAAATFTGTMTVEGIL